MKLRVLGDTVRLRLSKSEVERMAQTGRVEEAVHFGVQGETLRYALVSDATVEAIHATFRDGVIIVRVPAGEILRWTTTDEVGLRASQPIGEDRSLSILVEKDFRCLEPRPGEEGYDGFPNPKATC